MLTAATRYKFVHTPGPRKAGGDGRAGRIRRDLFDIIHGSGSETMAEARIVMSASEFDEQAARQAVYVASKIGIGVVVNMPNGNKAFVSSGEDWKDALTYYELGLAAQCEREIERDDR